MIKIENLHKSFGKSEIIKGVSAEIKKGEIFAIVGQSGAGKSTLLRCINGLENYQSGSLKVAGKEVADLKGDEVREFRKNIGMIFQHFALMSRKTVAENVATPLRFWKFEEGYIKERVAELLVLVGLKDKANAYPSELSGGQKQRVAIARALALKPQILLSDEATSALDPNTTTQILNLLKEINRSLGITIILVTHEMEVVKSIANRAMLLKHGVVVGSGDIVELFLHPDEHMKEFLGEEEVLPPNNINVRLFFPPDVAFDSIITHMAHELGINFNIVWGKLERLDKSVVGSLVINVLPTQLEAVEKYISEKGVIYEVVEKK
ncbi:MULTISPECIES: methionine ABC transporter ATP-binding protein [unclassified Campylobacter]|uniref:methionine ABC transporter ATP-binding protein n=1 Tax=unclassified Campylobacter TaxID=2593542 RepID=UPI0022E9AB35|nr:MULTISPECIES: methionine ABC transporter ATP-binding protein [unclassified Campylobacter]MDA3054151.1 methionine ABC transporter ATP-binding protein [Campylobacter sp. VBCF_07 NA4]MDA3060842.1 methionine ABC transporter ATP-binding protein [Campylobacter sp. VBCF_02 NA5]MDA3070355.1 methionine ABC transporter ATP-binding protein [Campylobacter sp. VBCF_08 NA3]WBR53666.1 methionine ABC transporter ATP-binding protein [Campylobacter sp. VBCF_01 NA2]